MNLYVGNLSYDVTEEELRREFESFGHVQHARIIKDQDTGKSKGYGFIWMINEIEAQAAMSGIASMRGKRVKIQEVHAVNEKGI